MSPSHLNTVYSEQPSSSAVVTNNSPRVKKSCRSIILSIIKNEVTWGIFVILCCALALIIIWAANTPVQWQSYKNTADEQGLIAIIAGIFAIVSICMSLVQIIQHFVYKKHQPSQKRIVRIIAIVPVYAATGWVAILFFDSAIYMAFIQSCFEAYVIYCFLLLLTKYLGGHHGVAKVIEGKEYIKLPFPFCRIKVRPTTKSVWYFKIGLLQYTWINPLCSGIAVILNLANIYNNGVWDFTRGYPYITIIINISQSLALYSLVAFYMNTKDELKPFKPLPKFLVIKLIVFFIFWQSVLMSGLAALHVLRNTTTFTVTEEKILLENVLICVEMFFFSIAYHWVFSWRPYADGSLKTLMESRYRHMNQKDDPEINVATTYF